MVITIKDKLKHAEEEVTKLNEEYDLEIDYIKRRCIDLNLQYWRGRSDALKELIKQI